MQCVQTDICVQCVQRDSVLIVLRQTLFCVLCLQTDIVVCSVSSDRHCFVLCVCRQILLCAKIVQTDIVLSAFRQTGPKITPCLLCDRLACEQKLSNALDLGYTTLQHSFVMFCLHISPCGAIFFLSLFCLYLRSHCIFLIVFVVIVIVVIVIVVIVLVAFVVVVFIDVACMIWSENIVKPTVNRQKQISLASECMIGEKYAVKSRFIKLKCS